MGKVIHTHTEQFPRLSYLKAGTGQALVLLHGFPENKDLWHNIWPELSKNFTVIVPDLPGTGESEFKGDEISLEQLAESIKAILDNESIDKAVIAGHSMGGYTALAFMDLFRDRVKGLSMVHSIALADSDEKKETRRKSIELVKKGGKEQFIKQMIPNLFSKAFKENHPDIMRTQVERGMMLDAKSIIAFYNAMIIRPDRTGILHGLQLPVQWIIGREDTVIPMDKMLENSKLADINFVSVYSDCAHMSMLEKPAELVKDLNDFGKYCFDN